MLPEPPCGFENPETAAEALGSLDRARFRGAAVTRLTLGWRLDPRDPGNRAAMLRATRSPEPLPVLLRLFVLGEPVPADAAAVALEPLPVSEWERAGYLEVLSTGEVRALVSLWPFAGFWVAADRDARESGDPDAVMGVSASTATVARLAVPAERVPAAADIGTGCGILALLLSQRAVRVVATDISERALAFARQNARWNAVSNIEFRAGDGFAPIAGETFDRMLCNPPYVIGPDRTYAFRDGAPHLVREWVRNAPEHLTANGFAQFLAHWPLGPDDGAERVLEWFEDVDADVGVLLGRVDPVESYANAWIGNTETREPTAHAESLDRWLEWFGEEKIARIGEGLITLRRPGSPGPRLRAMETVSESLDDTAPAELFARFERTEFLRVNEDGELRDLVLGVAPGVRILQESAYLSGGWASPRLRLVREDGLSGERAVEANAATLALVTRVDGERRLGAILEALEPGSGGEGPSPESWLLIARDLISEGYLEPFAG